MLNRLKRLFGGRSRGEVAPEPHVATAVTPEAPAPGADPEAEPRPSPATLERRIRRSDIDPDAAKIIRRLVRHGHTAYLVGGCVRDLLLRRKPKDFDISTSATPAQVRRLFRNCRIIGRRFQLAHIFFRNPGARGDKVIEVATFRAYHRGQEDTGEGGGKKEPEADLLITRDNVFGTPQEDAWRRDFTVNGLFYDLDRQEVIDHLGGMTDLRRRTLRSIGDPDIRFREDPIRILRAIRFAARLDFTVDPDTLEAMKRHRWEILRSAAPRILEELLRILRCGASTPAFVLLGETRTLEVLLPEVDGALHDDPSLVDVYMGILGEMDRRASAEEVLPASVLVSCLLMPLVPWDLEASDAREAQTRLVQLFEGVARRMRLSRRDGDAARRIFAAVPKMTPGYHARRFSRTALVRRPYFPELLTVFSILSTAAGRWSEAVAGWEERHRLQSDDGTVDAPAGRGRPRRPPSGRRPRQAADGPESAGGKRRRRSRRRRRGRGRPRETES